MFRFGLFGVIALILTGCFATPKIGGGPEAAPRLVSAELLRKLGSKEPLRFTCPIADETGGNHACKEVDGCETPKMCLSNYFDELEKTPFYAMETFAQNRDRPIGLALAGGGQRAASYSIGVLRGLHGIAGSHSLGTREEKALDQQIGAISSVSGGSYAALWYYSRIMEHHKTAFEVGANSSSNGIDPNLDFKRIFYDCLPAAYKMYQADKTDECPEPKSNYEKAKTPRDPWRYQNHLRGFSDLFDKGFDYDPNSKSNRGAKQELAEEIFWTLPTLPFHWLLRGVFNVKDLSLTLSGYRYFRNIERTYGLDPVQMQTFSHEERQERFPSNRRVAQGKTMSALAELYIHQEGIRKTKEFSSLPNIPLWIANTTADVRPDGYWVKNLPDPEDSVFEFTPFQFGSRHFGYWEASPNNFELARIAGASGAFVDSLKFKGLKRAGTELLLEAANSRWSVLLPNPKLQDAVRTQHKFLPFPLWLAHHPDGDSNSAWIRLSDGGMSENLGAFSLIRRGYKEIVISDHGADRLGHMEDLCYLKSALAARKLYLQMPELERFEEHCKNFHARSGGSKSGYEIWNWRHLVQLGCIASRPNTRCQTPSDDSYFARIFLLKPALPKRLVELATECESNCLEQFKELRKEGQLFVNLPAELFGFIQSNKNYLEKGKLIFPQHSTITMTLNSSPFLFGAYRELAAWQTLEISHLREQLATGSYKVRAPQPLADTSR
jgi:hypothetical protein